MRGRQQLYPTFGCAPNRALAVRKFPWDMPIPGARQWTLRDHARWARSAGDMSTRRRGYRGTAGQLGDAGKFR
jgi:hypothetical protein